MEKEGEYFIQKKQSQGEALVHESVVYLEINESLLRLEYSMRDGRGQGFGLEKMVWDMIIENIKNM